MEAYRSLVRWSCGWRRWPANENGRTKATPRSSRREVSVAAPRDATMTTELADGVFESWRFLGRVRGCGSCSGASPTVALGVLE